MSHITNICASGADAFHSATAGLHSTRTPTAVTYGWRAIEQLSNRN
jgi:hypothetical protein